MGLVPGYVGSKGTLCGIEGRVLKVEEVVMWYHGSGPHVNVGGYVVPKVRSSLSRGWLCGVTYQVMWYHVVHYHGRRGFRCRRVGFGLRSTSDS